MKKIKFLKDMYSNNTPVWYKNMTYEVLEEYEDTYRLFCEDMKIREIDKTLEYELFEVINNDK